MNVYALRMLGDASFLSMTKKKFGDASFLSITKKKIGDASFLSMTKKKIGDASNLKYNKKEVLRCFIRRMTNNKTIIKTKKIPPRRQDFFIVF